MHFKITIKLLLSLLIFCLPGCKLVTVNTSLGAIDGIDYERYQSFRGIPYAMPPVGDLRWQPPQAALPFTSDYQALDYKPGCTQFIQLTLVSESSEDCLYLNIWRPSSDATNLPVMVYIHGGSFVSDAASSLQYNGGALAAKENIIVVNMNFRQGYLGFLSVAELKQEAGHSGNYAFLDQNLALQWVHDHIGSFGGDPAHVMLVGESSGALATCAHLASPLSANLFQSAVMESGSCSSDGISPVVSEEKANAAGDMFAKAVGCDGDNRLACMRAKSVDELDSALEYAGFPKGVSQANGPVLYTILQDNYFMLEDANLALKNGMAAGKSIIIGTNKNEASLSAVVDDDIPDIASYIERLQATFEDNIEQLLQLYPYADYDDGLSAWSDLMTDHYFNCPALNTADALVAGGANVYFYHFTQPIFGSPIPFIMSNLAGKPDFDIGTFHASELPYVFNLDGVLGSLWGSNQITANLMQAYWLNNAAQNNPNNADSVTWPLYSSEAKNYLEIDTTPIVKAGFKLENCK